MHMYMQISICREERRAVWLFFYDLFLMLWAAMFIWHHTIKQESREGTHTLEGFPKLISRNLKIRALMSNFQNGGGIGFHWLEDGNCESQPWAEHFICCMDVWSILLTKQTKKKKHSFEEASMIFFHFACQTCQGGTGCHYDLELPTYKASMQH